MRERIAARKKKVTDEATKSASSKGKASKLTKKVTTDDKLEGRKLTRCTESTDRALNDCLGDIGDTEDATAADCTALRPLALKLAAVYEPCALQPKKTGLTKGAGDAHGIRSRRKSDIVN